MEKSKEIFVSITLGNDTNRSVPPLIRLSELLSASEKFLANNESAED